MNKLKYITYLCLSLLLAGCGADCGAEVGEKADIVRLDSVFFEYEAMDDAGRDSVRVRYGNEIAVWLKMQNIDSTGDSALIRYSRSRAVQIFIGDIRSRFVQLDSVRGVLAKLENSLVNNLPDIDFPGLYSVVSPFNQSVIIADSLMFVGLNHYLGQDYPGYGYFEPYQRIVKTPRHLPYDIAEAVIANSMPYEPTADAAVLNRLLYEGALLYAVMAVVPDAELGEALGYSPLQLQWAEDNESAAWNALISQKMLYSTSPSDADRLVNPSPVTSILHHESPGRLGRYIGYQIVKSYADKHPDAALSDLLAPQFYNSPQTLISASYRPR